MLQVNEGNAKQLPDHRTKSHIALKGQAISRGIIPSQVHFAVESRQRAHGYGLVQPGYELQFKECLIISKGVSKSTSRAERNSENRSIVHAAWRWLFKSPPSDSSKTTSRCVATIGASRDARSSVTLPTPWCGRVWCRRCRPSARTLSGTGRCRPIKYNGRRDCGQRL